MFGGILCPQPAATCTAAYVFGRCRTAHAGHDLMVPGPVSVSAGSDSDACIAGGDSVVPPTRDSAGRESVLNACGHLVCRMHHG